ncbi:LuxR C-terminal-related transcriptional regulator [Streptomyces sp. NPDC018045]|uniref:LuxR C-terminal-related transcriptional regulator n=1 Tax=Streptomyces sp. NPDC018045 TaxID=3365037 RepID=UPI0037B7DEF0
MAAPREKRLLILVARDKENPEIADALSPAPACMRTYLASLRRKLGIHGHRAALGPVSPFRDRPVDPGAAQGEAPSLSGHEQRLLRDAAAGPTLTEIAERAGQSYDHVKAWVAQMLSKPRPRTASTRCASASSTASSTRTPPAPARPTPPVPGPGLYRTPRCPWDASGSGKPGRRPMAAGLPDGIREGSMRNPRPCRPPRGALAG